MFVFRVMARPPTCSHTTVQWYIDHPTLFKDLNIDLLGDMCLLPHLDSVKTMVCSLRVFWEAVAGNYFGSEINPED